MAILLLARRGPLLQTAGFLRPFPLLPLYYMNYTRGGGKCKTIFEIFATTHKLLYFFRPAS
jgi:hypothetical protein